MIKLIALDIYGTVLPYGNSPLWGDPSGDCPCQPPQPRKGIDRLFDRYAIPNSEIYGWDVWNAESPRALIFSASDSDLFTLKEDLNASFRVHLSGRISADSFHALVPMNRDGAKDLARLIYFAGLEDIKIEPHEILMVGDNSYADGEGARTIGAHYLKVEPYMYRYDDFDLGEIDLRKFK